MLRFKVGFVCFLVLSLLQAHPARGRNSSFPAELPPGSSPSGFPTGIVIERPVTDRAGVLGSSDLDNIEDRLRGWRSEANVQMAVVILPTTAGIPIEKFALALATEWRGGDPTRSDGLLFLLSIEDRTMRLEIGKGLEAVFSPSFQRGTLDSLRPALREGFHGLALRKLIDSLQLEHSLATDPAGKGGKAGETLKMRTYRDAWTNAYVIGTVAGTLCFLFSIGGFSARLILTLAGVLAGATLALVSSMAPDYAAASVFIFLYGLGVSWGFIRLTAGVPPLFRWSGFLFGVILGADFARVGIFGGKTVARIIENFILNPLSEHFLLILGIGILMALATGMWRSLLKAIGGGWRGFSPTGPASVPESGMEIGNGSRDTFQEDSWSHSTGNTSPSYDSTDACSSSSWSSSSSSSSSSFPSSSPSSSSSSDWSGGGGSFGGSGSSGSW